MARSRSEHSETLLGADTPPPPPSWAVLLPAALIGAATGLRSQTGGAALLLGAGRDTLPAPLRSGRARAVAALLAVGEFVADQLPAAPDRTDPSGLVPRVVLGAGSAALLAGGRGRPRLAAAVTGAAAAVAAAFGGHRLRVAAARRHPVTAGLVEDGVAAGLGAVAVLLRRRV